jgi:MFS family permease
VAVPCAGAIRDALQLTAGQLGLLLLAGSAGAMLALPTAGAVVHRFGARRAVAGAALLISAGLSLVGVAAGMWGSVLAVGVGLFALGYGSGTAIAVHLLLVAVVMSGAVLVAVRSFLPVAPDADPTVSDARRDRAEPPGGTLLDAWREPRTVLIGLLVLEVEHGRRHRHALGPQPVRFGRHVPPVARWRRSPAPGRRGEPPDR